MLTSDGVLPRAQLLTLAQQGDAQAASQALVQAAVQAGTHDNARALVVRVRQLGAGRFEELRGLGRDLPVPGWLKVGQALDGFVVTAMLADTGALVVLKAVHEAHAGDAQERAMLAHEAWLASRIAQPRPPHGEATFVCTLALENPCCARVPQ